MTITAEIERIRDYARVAAEEAEKIAPTENFAGQFEDIDDDLTALLSRIREEEAAPEGYALVPKGGDATSSGTAGTAEYNAAPAAEAGADVVEREGHGQPCYYCGEPCDGFAGEPSRWPVGLPHKEAPGVVKWHHAGCVMERLDAFAAGRRAGLEEAAKTAEAEEELPGDAPLELFLLPIDDACRATVRVTKRNIAAAIRAKMEDG